ncbi:MAG: hypothetical protein EOS51_27265 [Mesorhizobium sp.]|uniref:hypothetical protein n=1 Tax=unclassified Mesorhizobium TaxID=325217 RepID=UPI000FE67D15|nr:MULTISPECIES: hypothetical protein [unclassified Mesorhizobium]RWC07587.1 MAG: hypothetical protein EOS51_27265 [Mesorhizobium sp.]TGT93868.1 hypothetical protein EN807_26835 [Mesorhizobium sp. M5C.F.Ca.ET.164.01.1.1]
MNIQRSMDAPAELVDSSKISFSVVRSSRPKTLTKEFWLEEGVLQKCGGGVLIEGRVGILKVDDLQDFGEALQLLGPNCALIYGLPKKAPAMLTTRDAWFRSPDSENLLTRTSDMFSWKEGPGILMLDYDPEPGEVLDCEQLVSAIRGAVPGLTDATMLWYPSASSHIVNADTGEDLTGLRGQRLYLAVSDARDIPRAGKAIVDALWLAGFGYVNISKSGQLLLRTIVDGTVWQTNRLDFAAGASCRRPLEQRRGKPVIIPGENRIIDTRLAIPDLERNQQEELKAILARARAEKVPEASDIQKAWVEAKAIEIAGSEADDASLSIAKDVAKRAVQHGTLSANFQIVVVEDSVEKPITVGEVLAHPTQFDGVLTLDPIEPGYDGGRLVGKLFLQGSRPMLFSFAHGGQSYRLLRQLHEIEVIKGKARDTVDATLAVLRHLPEVFDLGGALVVIEGGHIFPLDQAGVAHLLGGAIQYYRLAALNDGTFKRVLVDPPDPVIKQLLSIGERRHVKPLNAVITAPTLRLDGTILASPGYDVETRLFLDIPGVRTDDIAEVPTRNQVKLALAQLLKPFRDFPFVTADDRGVFLAALLTAILRPSLPTAPAFGFDAPVQGSGKTLLASCIGVLATGEPPAVYAHAGGKDDEEVRKRIFAALLYGRRVIVWDNLVGTFDSAAMAAALTSSSYTDRVLGRSETIAVPNRLLLLMTGNNLTLTGDMARRVLTCRIDPKTDRPFAREFDLDPLEYVLGHRQEMAAAGLTLVRGWLTSGMGRAPGRMASFENWDDLVRQTVVWLGRSSRDGEFGDPMNVVIAAQSADPDYETLTEMLTALSEIFGSFPFTAGKVLEAVLPYRDAPGGSSIAGARLAETLREFSENATRSARSLGRVLRYRAGRVASGRRLEMSTDLHAKTRLWRVVTTE